MRELEKIWMNGELIDWADAKVHVGTHGLHYGTGVFDGIRGYWGEPQQELFPRAAEHPFEHLAEQTSGDGLVRSAGRIAKRPFVVDLLQEALLVQDAHERGDRGVRTIETVGGELLPGLRSSHFAVSPEDVHHFQLAFG